MISSLVNQIQFRLFLNTTSVFAENTYTDVVFGKKVELGLVDETTMVTIYNHMNRFTQGPTGAKKEGRVAIGACSNVVRS